MTFTEAQTYVSRALQDTSNVYWTLALVKDLINQGCQDVARRSGFNRRWLAFDLDPAESGTSLYVPSLGYTLDEVLDLKTDLGPLRRTTVADLAEIDSDWTNTETASPTDYATDYKPGSVLVYPAPSEALTTLAGHVTTIYPTHVDGADDLLLPAAYHVLPCYFAIAEAYEVDTESTSAQKADRWRVKYEKGLDELGAQVARKWNRSRPTSPPAYL